jgi:hypothetical protein
VNPDAEQSLEIDETGKVAKPRPPAGLRELVMRAAGTHASRLDWVRVERAALRRSGVPTPILLPPGVLRAAAPGARAGAGGSSSPAR